MRTWLYIINNFAHDLFTGIWFGSFVGLYTVQAHALQSQPMVTASVSLVNDLQHNFFYLGAVSLLLVLLTGFVRFLYRRDWDKVESPVQMKKSVLIVKHILLGAAFLIGSFYAYQWTF